MDICIGIISYLPDDLRLRESRKCKLINLVNQCDKLLGLPIIIIAQNWGTFITPTLQTSKQIIYKHKNRLGIAPARKALRQNFINSNYTHMIMLDDDIVLTGGEQQFKQYLNQIKNNENKTGIFKSLTLQLMCITKSMFSKINYPDGTPDNGDYFEDMWLIMAIKKLYPDEYFSFLRCGVDAIGDPASDPESTWYHKQFNKHAMGDRTRAMIGAL